MRKDLWTKVLIFGIAALFIGTSIVPTTIGKKLQLNETLLDDKLLPNESLFYDTIDQFQDDFNTSFTIGWTTGRMGAQSFIPTLNTLTRVEIPIVEIGTALDSYVVSIRSSLNGSDLTNISVDPSVIPEFPGWIEFDFPDISVVPGNVYYIVSKTENNNDSYHWGVQSGNPYSRGNLFLLWESSSYQWEVWNDDDFAFKTYGYNESAFFVIFGLTTIDGTIDYVFYDNNSRMNYFVCLNVSKVTVTGFGTFLNLQNPQMNIRFYKQTFTNVTSLGGTTYKKLDVSNEEQHFSTFGLRRCAILVYE